MDKTYLIILFIAVFIAFNIPSSKASNDEFFISLSPEEENLDNFRSKWESLGNDSQIEIRFNPNVIFYDVDYFYISFGQKEKLRMELIDTSVDILGNVNIQARAEYPDEVHLSASFNENNVQGNLYRNNEHYFFRTEKDNKTYLKKNSDLIDLPLGTPIENTARDQIQSILPLNYTPTTYPIHIRILVVYSPQAQSESPDISASISSYMNTLRGVMLNSQLNNIHFDLAGAELLSNHSLSSKIGYEHLRHVRDSSAVQQLREQYHADLVAFIAGSSEVTNVCGNGYLGPNQSWAYSLTNLGCSDLVFAHEIGHNMGAHHNPEEIYKPPVDQLAYDWGMGYLDTANKFSTVMSYNCANNACPRIPYWSTPLINYQGHNIGTTYSDNRRVIMEASAIVADFMPHPQSSELNLTVFSGFCHGSGGAIWNPLPWASRYQVGFSPYINMQHSSIIYDGPNNQTSFNIPSSGHIAVRACDGFCNQWSSTRYIEYYPVCL